MRIVDDVVSVIKGSIELWPTLVEICYFQKTAKDCRKCECTIRKSDDAENSGIPPAPPKVSLLETGSNSPLLPPLRFASVKISHSSN